MEIVSYCTKSGRMSRKLVSGKYLFPSPGNVWRHWHSRSKISHEPSNIFLPCTWVCMGLDGSTCSECLPMVTCYFETQSTCHSARAHTCAVVLERVPCVRRSREHEKRPAAGREEKCRCAKKTHLYIIQGSPSCVWREIPGVTQVDEKGLEGNTAVESELMYVGGNMVKETAGQEFLLTTTIYFEHDIILVQQSCWVL